ncbi:MAG: putative oxidoreductase [Verrucomicrobiota bacterium]
MCPDKKCRANANKTSPSIQYALSHFYIAAAPPIGLTCKIDILNLATMNSLNRYADTVFCLMRLIVGLLFACHGGQKLLGFPPGGHGAGQGIMLVGAWIELVGGFMIAFGLLTRVAALICSGEMAVAYCMMHIGGAPEPMAKFFPILNHGEPAVIYCWVFLFIFFYGAGRLSIDALIARSRAGATTTTVGAA